MALGTQRKFACQSFTCEVGESTFKSCVVYALTVLKSVCLKALLALSS